MIQLHANPTVAIKRAGQVLHDYGYPVKTEKWHGAESPGTMQEFLNFSFTTPCSIGVEELQRLVEPNLPWAEDHFQERVCGEPLNPGVQYANWPYYKGKEENDKFRTAGEHQFDHTYMERYWPPGLQGIRYGYGDLADVVALLFTESDTRQAYLPVWFPEDTGVTFGGRVPCTLGYWFILRNNALHCVYYIRSCDFFRHFRDDIYLSMRLQQWVLGALRKREEESPRLTHNRTDWRHVQHGMFTMHIGSLHCFSQEKGLLLK